MEKFKKLVAGQRVMVKSPPDRPSQAFGVKKLEGKVLTVREDVGEDASSNTPVRFVETSTWCFRFRVVPVGPQRDLKITITRKSPTK